MQAKQGKQTIREHNGGDAATLITATDTASRANNFAPAKRIHCFSSRLLN